MVVSVLNFNLLTLDVSVEGAVVRQIFCVIKKWALHVVIRMKCPFYLIFDI